ncbi:MAG: hypothetical protein VYD19_07225, partial [Myxococcota bacterium]|nr:hypothetical protein [Myxococcota bacterium]
AVLFLMGHRKERSATQAIWRAERVQWALDRESDSVSLMVAERHAPISLLGGLHWRRTRHWALTGKQRPRSPRPLSGESLTQELRQPSLWRRLQLDRWRGRNALSLSCSAEGIDAVLARALGEEGELLSIELSGLLNAPIHAVDLSESGGAASSREGHRRQRLRRLLAIASALPFERIFVDLRCAQTDHSRCVEEPCMLFSLFARSLLAERGEMLCLRSLDNDAHATRRAPRLGARAFRSSSLTQSKRGWWLWRGGLRVNARRRTTTLSWASALLTSLLGACGELESLDYNPRPSIEDFARFRPQLKALGCAGAGCHRDTMGGVELNLSDESPAMVEADYLSLKPFLLGDPPEEAPLLRRLRPPGSGHPICFEETHCLYQELKAWIAGEAPTAEESCVTPPEGWRCQTGE